MIRYSAAPADGVPGGGIELIGHRGQTAEGADIAAMRRGAPVTRRTKEAQPGLPIASPGPGPLYRCRRDSGPPARAASDGVAITDLATGKSCPTCQVRHGVADAACAPVMGSRVPNSVDTHTLTIRMTLSFQPDHSGAAVHVSGVSAVGPG